MSRQRYEASFGGDHPALRLSVVKADNCPPRSLITGRDALPSTSPALRAVGTQRSLDGEVVRHHKATNVLANPLLSLSWLISYLAHRGQRLSVRSLVFTGTLTAPMALRPGVLARRSKASLRRPRCS